MRAIHMQRVLAFVFLELGAWLLLFPEKVEALGRRAEYFVGNLLILGCGLLGYRLSAEEAIRGLG